MLGAVLAYFLEDINSYFIVAFGAFSGAGAAFFLNTFHSKEEQRLRNIAALEKTKYILGKYSNESKQLSDYIKKCNDTNNGHFNWEKIGRYKLLFMRLKIDCESILFLLEDTEDGRKTLDSILCVDAERHIIKSSVKERNEAYTLYLDKTENRVLMNKQGLEEIVGKRSIIELDNITKLLIKTNNELTEDCNKAEKNINDFLNKLLISKGICSARFS